MGSPYHLYPYSVTCDNDIQDDWFQLDMHLGIALEKNDDNGFTEETCHTASATCSNSRINCWVQIKTQVTSRWVSETQINLSGYEIQGSEFSSWHSG